MPTPFQSENLKARDHLGDVGIDGMILFKRILKEQDLRVWTGYNST
jgi:hypothetical protein